MDGEIAYLLKGFEKSLLFQGGASYLTGSGDLPIEDFTRESHAEAFNAFIEGVLFAVCSQQALLGSREIYLSGRLTRYENKDMMWNYCRCSPARARQRLRAMPWWVMDYMVEVMSR